MYKFLLINLSFVIKIYSLK